MSDSSSCMLSSLLLSRWSESRVTGAFPEPEREEGVWRRASRPACGGEGSC